ncbi:MAG: hypothetical protein JOZ99_13360, partial [Actinobacteria bacterium]|nr:hypothetical protein [Actinomycetota bacterium]
DDDDAGADVAVEIPADVPEADALEQGRQPAIPLPERLPRLPDDAEVPEADALEQGRQPAIPLPERLPRLPHDAEVPEADALEQAEPASAYLDSAEDERALTNESGDPTE